MNYAAAEHGLYSEKAQDQLAKLYGDADSAAKRYARLIQLHRNRFQNTAPVTLLCSPGRAEVVGNHTDHNRGRVLAAAVKLDIAAAVTPRDDKTVRVYSEGYGETAVDLNVLEPVPGEDGTSAALIRGVEAFIAGFAGAGCPMAGLTRS